MIYKNVRRSLPSWGFKGPERASYIVHWTESLEEGKREIFRAVAAGTLTQN